MTEQPMTEQNHPGRVLRDLSHGGIVEPTEVRTAVTRELAEVSTPFDYLFETIRDDPAAHLPDDDPAAIVAALDTLGRLMVESQPPPQDPFQSGDGNSTIPAVYTYLGQFVDHDITANTDRPNEIGHVTDADLHPALPADVIKNLRNLRVPALDLDSVYGDGPTFPGGPQTEAASLYDGITLKLGRIALMSKPGTPPIQGARIPLQADLERDVPRGVGDNPLQAGIGDARNDENLIVAQLHVAFLRFHNRTVDWVRRHEPQHTDEKTIFERARQLVRWHYQWIVINDYLATIALPGVVDQVLTEGNTFYDKRAGEVYMPLEFSVASFRFGHTMVRGAYDFNRNFGRQGHVLPSAPFDQIFRFTGKGGFGGQADTLPFNWVIEWDRLVEKDPRFPDHFSRKIDTRLAFALGEMANEIPNPAPGPDITAILEQLAVRNLRRGYQLSIPTGQAVAEVLNLVPLTQEELRQGNSDELNTHLANSGFLDRTPLWYYVLKEAEVQSNGNSLGELGSRIVVETLVGQVRHDPGSFLGRSPSWVPEDGVLLPDGRPILTIKDFLRFAGVLPTRP
ncbi:peroxidase family protein [Pseudonocardia alaniniphila]|uniref:Heme peroxidase family protein n=1 Tax=Pseudonocardia alaniniphila TaxID=75291 RepID=A0ABS9TDA0_9PSEU|nr:heme peroxidase family protein [Pseudonocardia alaniniphila]MCH6166373.1 heme peroxidase family protein [Pseudonocardia alaniniphila]